MQRTFEHTHYEGLSRVGRFLSLQICPVLPEPNAANRDVDENSGSKDIYVTPLDSCVFPLGHNDSQESMVASSRLTLVTVLTSISKTNNSTGSNKEDRKSYRHMTKKLLIGHIQTKTS